MNTENDHQRVGRHDHAGFSLLEVIICMSILTIAVSSLVFAIMTANHLNNRSSAEALALAAAEGKLSEIRETPFANIVATFSGQTFTIANLTPPTAGTAQGEVIIINSEAPNEASFGRNLGVAGGASGVDLNGNGRTDDVLVGGFGMDINGDGVVPTAGQVAPASMALIPVVVLIRWNSSEGIQRLQLVTTIVNRYP